MWSCAATVFSRSLEMKGRFDMGRKLLRSAGSEPGFLRRGVTAAVLRGEGTSPEMREAWMIFVMRGARAVGRGSSWQEEVFDF